MSVSRALGRCLLWAVLTAGSIAWGDAARAEFPPARPEAQVRCLALIAYAEAAIDGRRGMEAVIRVMRNRVGDPRFPKDACAVAVQPGQFQPVGERESLRNALADPLGADLVTALGGETSVDLDALDEALALAKSADRPRGADPTNGALYFVNPAFMDPAKCGWFAGLKRTAQIGGHVFMTHYAPGEAAKVPALDCSMAGTGRVIIVKADPLPSPKPPALSSPIALPVRYAVRNPLGQALVLRLDTRLDYRIGSADQPAAAGLIRSW